MGSSEWPFVRALLISLLGAFIALLVEVYLSRLITLGDTDLYSKGIGASLYLSTNLVELGRTGLVVWFYEPLRQIGTVQGLLLSGLAIGYFFSDFIGRKRFARNVLVPSKGFLILVFSVPSVFWIFSFGKEQFCVLLVLSAAYLLRRGRCGALSLGLTLLACAIFVRATLIVPFVVILLCDHGILSASFIRKLAPFYFSGFALYLAVEFDDIVPQAASQFLYSGEQFWISARFPLLNIMHYHFMQFISPAADLPRTLFFLYCEAVVLLAFYCIFGFLRRRLGIISAVCLLIPLLSTAFIYGAWNLGAFSRLNSPWIFLALAFFVKGRKSD